MTECFRIMCLVISIVQYHVLSESLSNKCFRLVAMAHVHIMLLYVAIHLFSCESTCTYACVKPGSKSQKLGTLGDFEFVVDYSSTISLDIVFKIS